VGTIPERIEFTGKEDKGKRGKGKENILKHQQKTISIATDHVEHRERTK
jgi:hypothetical protein